MRVQYASCSRSNLAVYCKSLSAAMPYVPLLLLLLRLGSAQQQLPQPTAAAAMPATTTTTTTTTPAAAVVAAIFEVVLLLSLSCAGEIVSSAQAPLEVGTARRRRG